MYSIDVLIQGYPGRSLFHGSLGWSTTTLLRGEGRRILVDVGAFGARHLLAKQLAELKVAAGDITDVVLTHAHYDHSVNFTLFPNATVWIGEKELAWAAAQPPGFDPLPELYVRELEVSPRVKRIQAGDRFLPGFRAVMAPGHTPGHLLFYVTGNEGAILFTGDAAKNRAELLAMTVADTYDQAISQESLALIWDYWKREPGTLLVPGHDLCMRLDEAGQPRYVGERRAVLTAWLGDTMEPTSIDLCCGGAMTRYSA
ncbi:MULTISPECIES: MBL fold metallo-hydrolase [unclassified Achromobacter]|uniref:MBL fold metallo-hydrolase n=1 Tax=unclassified Achromobacter TaxID=2626865 RepID=UPI000B518C11|nr:MULTISPECIES: MBL fold metallo-hydrolase [unclassified Achromobacter]OWT69101.1 MBL fold hydrolase [Achromobacter sp. HZ34]OWT70506.1 MBL fold hydrolase [Achromobacter sp. HZ28]